MTKLITIGEITKDLIPDGSTIAIGGVHSHNVPMSLVRQLVRIKSKQLKIIGSISVGLPIDLLVGMGCVAEVYAPYVGFEMWGLAPNYRKAVESEKIYAPDVCEAFPVYSLRAGSNDIPFHPFPEGIHDQTSIPTQSDLYQKIKDPFTGKEVYAIQAIQPDIALIHVQKANLDGNCVHLGSVVTDRLMATAAKTVIVTCDELIGQKEIQDNPNLTTIPGIFVDYLIPLENAAHPTSSHGKYNYDAQEIKDYLKSCRDISTYTQFMQERIDIGELEYLEKFFDKTKLMAKKEWIQWETEDFSTMELIICVFANDIKDGELGICGAVSDIPMAAMKLAKELYTPNMSWIAGGSGYINPRGTLVPSSTDYKMQTGADARLSMDEVIPIEMMEIDFFFAGGLQIDGLGNTNLAGIQVSNKWKLKGPGSVGLPFLTRAGRIYLYTLTHNKRTLVEKVNYLSGPGFIKGNKFGGGPKLLITNLCVFEWEKSSSQWKLLTIHPNSSLEEIIENTGFEFKYDDEILRTSIPSENELIALRKMDPDGYLRGVTD